LIYYVQGFVSGGERTGLEVSGVQTMAL
jgi:hypothetical protein